MYAKAKIEVLVVDDSALVRQTLGEMLSTDPQIEVIGAVRSWPSPLTRPWTRPRRRQWW